MVSYFFNQNNAAEQNLTLTVGTLRGRSGEIIRFVGTYRSKRSLTFFKIGVLKNFAIFT